MIADLVRKSGILRICPHQNQPKIKKATIQPIFEVGTPKLFYNPKLYSLLGVYGKNIGNTFEDPKTKDDKYAPPVQVSRLRHQFMEG